LGKVTLTVRSALWALRVTASGKAITRPEPEVAVPEGTKTETKPLVCCVGVLIVLTLTPELELAACVDAVALEDELALEEELALELAAGTDAEALDDELALELAAGTDAEALGEVIALEETVCAVADAVVTLLVLNETVNVGSTELVAVCEAVVGAATTTGSAITSAVSPLCWTSA